MIGRRHTLGDIHEKTLDSIHILAEIYLEQGKHDKAAPLVSGDTVRPLPLRRTPLRDLNISVQLESAAANWPQNSL